MKNLEEYKVQELSFDELSENDGGILIALAGLGLAAFAIGYTIGRDQKCGC